ncbi:MAG: hypothetical protein ACE5IM_02470, partial [Nitrospinota bacterium]
VHAPPAGLRPDEPLPRLDDPQRWVNVAVFDSTAAIEAAFSSPEFDRVAKGHPGYRDVGLYVQIRSVKHV